MEVNLNIMIPAIINFIILLALLKHFFFSKIEAIIDEREALINEQLDNAEEEENRARILAVENKRVLKQAKEEGNKIIERKKDKAKKVYEEITKEAQDEAKLILDRAKVEVKREKEKAESQIKDEVISLALDLSQKILEQNISQEKNSQMIDDFITKVGS